MTSFQAVHASSPLHNGLKSRLPPFHRTFSDSNHLAPEDAFLPQSSSSKRRDSEAHTRSSGGIVNGDLTDVRAGGSARRPRDKERGRSGSRRRKGVWKKLLWVKQPYPDNYTDPPSFLSHLQRNPRLLPYDFWPLVADSTVIVQHICSVAVFICCFVGIFQERISPVSVVSWGSAGTVLGWVLWDFWVGQEEAAKALLETTTATHGDGEGPVGDDASSADSTLGSSTPVGVPAGKELEGLGISLSAANLAARQNHSHSASAISLPSASSAPSPTTPGHPTGAPNFANYSYYPPHNSSTSTLSPRNQQRLATAKSAILIYCALLGLSPILKSLTKSTTSDSIWAMSCWLMCINVFFFDYSGGVGVKFPASLSTNAALMASTVLASRLPSTTHVFSLTLFSIEVFGLFPVFRRHLRHISWRGHLLLTLSLTIAAGAGMGVTLASKGATGGGGWKAAVIGIVMWGLGTAVGMGGCSWWLIGLQKYKNVVIGPWDPARPVLRGGHWD